MATLVTYDPATGEITGRLIVSRSTPDQMENYPHCIEIDREDYHSAPETWAEVDLEKKKLKVKLGRSDPRKRP